jgi:hypothetical protein
MWGGNNRWNYRVILGGTRQMCAVDLDPRGDILCAHRLVGQRVEVQLVRKAGGAHRAHAVNTNIPVQNIRSVGMFQYKIYSQ